MTTNGADEPLYTENSYKNDITLRWERSTALAKTRLDNQFRDQVRAGDPSVERSMGAVTERFRQHSLQAMEDTNSVISEETLNTAHLAQVGEMFEQTPLSQVMSRLPAAPPSIASRVWGSLRSFPGAAGGLAAGVGGALVRSLVPGFAETEFAATYYGTWAAATFGEGSAIGAAGAAVAAAPFAAASVVVASAAGGYIVGDVVGHAVEQATGSKAAGVGAGVLAGAATGALIGAAIGTIVPVLGTGVGAAIGGVVGGIAGFIGSYW